MLFLKKMTRVSYWVILFLLISIETPGQCVNGPTVKLSSTSGNTCGITSVTISGNTFGGSATMVTISENGTGTVSPVTATASPFAFTYTPKSRDIGNKVLITVTTNNPLGRPCTAAKLTYTLTVNAIPSAPVIGTITQPSCLIPTGSVVLKGLPANGTWTITRTPDGTTTTGTGTSTTISGLAAGSYIFTVGSAGCISALSGDVVIGSNPSIPTIIITDPAPVCFPSTVDLTASSITVGSSAGLTYTYWKNIAATLSYSSPSTATDGTYYIKGTIAATGCSDVKPVTVIVRQKPVANAGPDKVLDYLFATKLEALSPGANETGNWSVLSGSGLFSDYADAGATVSNLTLGKNIFLWTLTNGVCLQSSDSISVTVKDLVIPTLITPNMDGRNDYFVIGEIETLGKIELVIFDRRGVQVYKNLNYDNRWNGIDSYGNPLSDNTYFYLLKTENGKSVSGYIVIRR